MVQHRVVQALSLLSKVATVVMASGAMLLGSPSLASADQAPPLQVVASFSVLGDMVKEIGGQHVNVVTIVGPNADTHSFEPTPQAIQALSNAQVLVENGLNFEVWLPRLIKSSGFSGAQIIASKGVAVRKLDGHDHDKTLTQGTAHAHADADADAQTDVDPHAWLSLKNGMIYARNIAEGLAMADPARAADYQRRANKYIATMQKLDVEVTAALDAIPEDSRKAITAHNAFGYFGEAYGVEFIPIAGLAADAEPSAQDIAALVDRVRQENRVGIFTEKTSSSKLVEQVAREANITVGGPLYPDALDDPDEPAGTYLGMFHWNAGQLISVLKLGEARSPQ